MEECHGHVSGVGTLVGKEHHWVVVVSYRVPQDREVCLNSPHNLAIPSLPSHPNCSPQLAVLPTLLPVHTLNTILPGGPSIAAAGVTTAPGGLDSWVKQGWPE
jgi:hypothetical protein